jgi:uncharacterized protein (DUF1330 family)
VNVHILVERQEGKYLSRSGNITAIEGAQQDCSLIVVMQFRSKGSLQAFVNAPRLPALPSGGLLAITTNAYKHPKASSKVRL